MISSQTPRFAPTARRIAMRSLPSLAIAQQSMMSSSAAAFVTTVPRHPINTSSTTIDNNKNNMMRRSFSTTPQTNSPPPTGSEILASYHTITHTGNNIPHAMEMLAKADAVCFDVDSTVIDEEGIDVLADTLGKGPEVSSWTAKAMDGNIKFEDALAARLEIIQPSKLDIQTCLEKHPLRLSPGVDRLVEVLQKRGTHVFLVSGGFRLMIEPVAKLLGVCTENNIYANTILFDEEGNYAGFDAEEPTSADQGKPKALRMIKEKYGYETMIMVGDGATDAQACPPADAFIGFGGVVTRQAVKDKACWFVEDFETMIDIVSKFDKN